MKERDGKRGMDKESRRKEGKERNDSPGHRICLGARIQELDKFRVSFGALAVTSR